jgi:hypothetical protein
MSSKMDLKIDYIVEYKASNLLKILDIIVISMILFMVGYVTNGILLKTYLLQQDTTITIKRFEKTFQFNAVKICSSTIQSDQNEETSYDNYQNYLSVMWRNVSAIGLHGKKFPALSGFLIQPDIYADAEILDDPQFFHQSQPVMMRQYDEQNLITFFDTHDNDDQKSVMVYRNSSFDPENGIICHSIINVSQFDLMLNTEVYNDLDLDKGHNAVQFKLLDGDQEVALSFEPGIQVNVLIEKTYGSVVVTRTQNLDTTSLASVNAIEPVIDYFQRTCLLRHNKSKRTRLEVRYPNICHLVSLYAMEQLSTYGKLLRTIDQYMVDNIVLINVVSK